MKTRRSIPRNQVVATAIFILLALLGIYLWLTDPAHQTPDKSRIAWPAVSPTEH